MTLIEASRDLKALEGYLPRFIEFAATHAESGLAARRRTQRLAVATDPERLERLNSPDIGIPYAFELWIGHLGWLDHVSAGVAFSPADLTPEEAQGLAILRKAR